MVTYHEQDGEGDEEAIFQMMADSGMRTQSMSMTLRTRSWKPSRIMQSWPNAS